MKKKIWILNHYATNSFYNKGGRHLWFAENLIKKGYNPTIFSATTRHNTNSNLEISKGKFRTESQGRIPFVFVKTPSYKGNGLQRIKNMIMFYRNLFPVTRDYINENGKPDIILASSVHPLTLIAGIKIAKKIGVPCICEIRDLWPESLIAFGSLKRESKITKILYLGEKWIYKNADQLIFTMEGGIDYIKDRKWDIDSGGPVNLNKVFHINNGVDLERFDFNLENNKLVDEDLNNQNTFKVIYTGSIRKANNIDLILNAAKYVKGKTKKEVAFIIYGDGDEREILENKVKSEKIYNVIFKGRVDKKYIPYILSKSNLNILNYSYHEIWKYGGSQNKNFEYLAAGKPILSTIKMGYDIIENNYAGISLKEQTIKTIGESIIQFTNMDEKEYKLMSVNSRITAQEYDFTKLTNKLISIIEDHHPSLKE